MKDHERRKVERSGAFIGPYATTPAPIRTLSDEYSDKPEPEDSDRVPDPEPEGLVTKVVHALSGKHPHDEG
jgi:hypothetical protein